MMIRTKMRSMLKLEPDETVVEWLFSVIFIIFVIIVVFVVGPPKPPGYQSPSEQANQEVINNEN